MKYVPIEESYLQEIVSLVAAQSFNIETDEKLRLKAQDTITIDLNTIAPQEALLLIVRLSEKALQGSEMRQVPNSLRPFLVAN